MPLTRRELLGTTALAAIAVADMLGPNGSWGPLVWPSDDSPPVRHIVKIEESITVNETLSMVKVALRTGPPTVTTTLTTVDPSASIPA